MGGGAGFLTESSSGVTAYMRELRAAEAWDRDGQRWPRDKPEDDATVVVIDFHGEQRPDTRPR